MNIWRQLYKAGLHVRGVDIATRGEFAIRGRSSWDGIFSRKRVTPAQITTVGAATYTIAQMQTGLILRDPVGADRSDVTPTAALLVAAFKTPYVGLGFEFDLWNQSDHAGASEVITITGGAGCTLSPTAITLVRGERKRFIVEVTNITAGAEAYTVHEVGRQREPSTVKKAITTDIGTGNKTLTAAQMLGGIVHQDPGGAANVTLATATLVIAALDNPIVGTSFDFFLCNDASGAAELMTLVAGAGNTLVPAAGMVLDKDEILHVIGIVTAIGTPAITYYGLGGNIVGLTSTIAELNILDGVVATAAEINANCDVLTVELITTKAVGAAETGTRFVLNHATAFVSTLPAPAAGLEYWFYAGATQVTGGNHTIYANGGANIIHGKICSAEDAAGTVVCHDDADTISFIADLMIEGDYVHLWSDGTSWFIDGICDVQDGMTTTQAA